MPVIHRNIFKRCKEEPPSRGEDRKSPWIGWGVIKIEEVQIIPPTSELPRFRDNTWLTLGKIM